MKETQKNPREHADVSGSGNQLTQDINILVLLLHILMLHFTLQSFTRKPSVANDTELHRGCTFL